MKQFLTCIAIITVLFCKAQSIIVPLGSNDNIEFNPNYYEKDVNNEFGKFEGTWKYQQGTSEIILKLKKEEHYLSPSNYYTDMLVGEYQYIDNGTQKVNTLTDFDNLNVSGYEHHISGGVYTHVLPSSCTDNSLISEIKISVFIKHPTDQYAEGRMILRYVNDNGTEKLQACIYDYTTMGDNGVTLDIPNGYYEFIKQ